MDLSIYRLRTRDILTLCVLALLMLVEMVQSASVSVRADGLVVVGQGNKHAMSGAQRPVTFFIVGAVDHRSVSRKAKSWKTSIVFWIFAVGIVSNLIVLAPHVGVSVNHARRWIPLGPVQVQPSELAKWAVVVYLAWFLTHRPLNLDKFWTGFLPLVAPIGLICLLIVIEDFGTATLIALAALMMMLAGKIRWRHLLLAGPPIVAVGLWFIMHKEYRWRRIAAFANPYAAPQKEGYHMIQSLLSFATGGLTGRGLGNGIQKLGYLPEDTTDFIFAVICEELGLFGEMLTIVLYLGILYCAWQTLKDKKDDFGRLLAFGVGAMVCLQALINIAVATVSVPTKGLSLPLISAGGSGLVITCAALGMLRSACRFEHAAERPKLESSPDEDDPSMRVWFWPGAIGVWIRSRLEKSAPSCSSLAGL